MVAMAPILDFRSEQFCIILDLQVTLILSIKFRVNWPSGVGGVGF